MKNVPAFPPPSSNDPPEVATKLRNAAALWSVNRHREALSQLVRAAAAAQQRSGVPKSDPRVIELAVAVTELTAFVDSGEDPRSIPISIDFDAQSVSLSSLEESMLEVPRRASVPQQTMREEDRPAAPARPIPKVPPRPPPRPDLTQTLGQAQRAPQPPQPPLNIRVVAPPAQTPPAQTLREAPFTEPSERTSALPTKRMEDVPTRRAPDEGGDEK